MEEKKKKTYKELEVECKKLRDENKTLKNLVDRKPGQAKMAIKAAENCINPSNIEEKIKASGLPENIQKTIVKKTQ